MSLLQPRARYVVVAADGSVESVQAEAPDLEEVWEAAVVCPGFIDIHNHGLGGSASVLTYWMHPEYTTQRLPRHGTTGLLATVVFHDEDLETTVREDHGPTC